MSILDVLLVLVWPLLIVTIAVTTVLWLSRTTKATPTSTIPLSAMSACRKCQRVRYDGSLDYPALTLRLGDIIVLPCAEHLPMLSAPTTPTR